MPSGWDVAYYVLLPFAWLFRYLFLLLQILAIPLIIIARFIWNVLMIPLRFLYRFETLFYYLGTAALVGALLGTVLHYLAYFIKSSLALDQDDQDEKVMEATWREQLDERKAKKGPRQHLNDRPLLSLAMPSTGYTGIPHHSKLTPKSPSPMMSTAILEEDDSSSEDYF